MDFRRIKFEIAKEKFFRWCKEKWNLTKEKAQYLWDNYKYEIITMGPIAIAGIAKIAKSIASMQNAKAEENHRLMDIYDHSTGQYYHCKRPLTNQERLELERRLDNGEKKGQILRDMGLI